MNIKTITVLLVPLLSISLSIFIYFTNYASNEDTKNTASLFTTNETLPFTNEAEGNVDQSAEAVQEELPVNEDIAFEKTVVDETHESFAKEFLDTLKLGTEASLEYFEESRYITYTYQSEQDNLARVEEFTSKVSQVRSAYYNSSYIEGFVQYIIVTINDRKLVLRIVERKDLHHDTKYYLIDEDVEQFLNMITL